MSTVTEAYAGCARHELDEASAVYCGRLPDELVFDVEQFEVLWNMHPNEYHTIKIHGRLVRTPRWQQAYGADYHYTGRVNRALAILPILEPLLSWSKSPVTIASTGFS